MAMIVHTVTGSPYGRAVLATLEEKGAPYSLAPVAPTELRSESHVARHPFGKVPVLDHDGFLLYETQAILRYLDRILPSPPLTPSDPRAAARMDQAMAICDWYLFHGVGNVIVFQRKIRPMLLGQEPDEAAISEAMPRAHRVYGELERFLGERTYFAGDDVTLADMLLAPHLDFFSGTPELSLLTADTPCVVAWLDRMKRRPSMAATARNTIQPG